MNTTISNKLAALALALIANSVIMGGVAYLFSDSQYAPAAVTATAAHGSGGQAIV